MAYCTLDDIKQRVPVDELEQLTDDEDYGQVNTNRVNTAIASADQVIDGYLRGRHYTVPLTTVPGLIKDISVDIATYKLYERRYDVRELPDATKQIYKNSINLLKEIQKGTVSLGIEPTGTDRGEYRTNKASTDRTFNSDTWDTY